MYSDELTCDQPFLVKCLFVAACKQPAKCPVVIEDCVEGGGIRPFPWVCVECVEGCPGHIPSRHSTMELSESAALCHATIAAEEAQQRRLTTSAETSPGIDLIARILHHSTGDGGVGHLHEQRSPRHQ